MSFIEDFQSTVNEVVVSGLIIPDTQLVVTLLRALQDSWRSFISIQVNQGSTLTYVVLIGKVLQEDSMRAHKIHSNKSEPKIVGALFASSKGNFRKHPRLYFLSFVPF